MDTLEADEALELLRKIVGAQRVTAEHQPASTIVTMCGGLPLALRIAGARLAARADWLIAKFAERLANERRRLAELGAGDLDVRASFWLSYRALPDQQTQAFRLLGLWPGQDFHPWVLGALMGSTPTIAEGLIDGLVAAQLVEPAAIRGRYQMHDLIRLFAVEQLDETADEERTNARTQLLETSRDLANWWTVAWESTHVSADQGNLLPRETAEAWLEVERGGFVSMARLAADEGPRPMAWKLANSLDHFLDRRGYWTDFLNAYQAALDAARSVNDRGEESRILNNLSPILARLGRWEDAIRNYRRSLATFQELGDSLGAASVLHNLGNLVAHQGHWADSIEYHEQSLRIYRDLGKRRNEAEALTAIGTVLDAQGRWQEAITYHERSLSILKDLEDRYRQAYPLNNIGTVLLHMNRWREGSQYFRQSAGIYHEVGDRYREAETLANLGGALLQGGKWQQAVQYFEESLKTFRDLNNPRGQSQALSGIGTVRYRQGYIEQAMAYFMRAS